MTTMKDKETPNKVAVFCVHGMGQQMRFTTLEQVARGIRRLATVTQQRAASYVIDSHLRQRLEMTVEVNRATSAVKTELHVYEGYWAPVTEGQVSLPDVMSFLTGAAWNSLILRLSGFSPFRRWMFGKFNEFAVPLASFFHIAITLFVVLLLLVLNAGAVLLTYGALNSASGLPSWLNKAFIDFTTFVLSWLSIAVTFIVLFWLALLQRKILWRLKAAPSIWIGRGLGILSIGLGIFLFGWISPWGLTCRGLLIVLGVAVALLFFWSPKDRESPSKSPLWIGYTLTLDVLFWLWLGAFVLTGLCLALLLAWGQVDRTLWDRLPSIPTSQNLWLIWPPILVVTGIVRRLLVQYIGDVAAYVSPHRLDRFRKIREEIRDEAVSVLRHIYTQKEYERIIVVGHSLGSVIAYDALNIVLAEAELRGEHFDLIDRTKLFLTFGSPLDKVAFVFAQRGDAHSEARGRLAEVRQPLIKSYDPFRKIPWVNVYAKRDIIGAPLNFFDEESPPANLGVVNTLDPDALIPLVAHGEYWDNETVFQHLLRAL
jgi:hypothetical protein